MLTVTSPAEDPTLASIEAMRLAAGLVSTDASRDVELAMLNKRVSADIAVACRVAIGNGADPTLRQETLSQVFRKLRRHGLVLARRHNVEIVSILLDGSPLDLDDDCYVDSEAGMLIRLSGGSVVEWCGRMATVVYKAGFEEVPADLAGAATDLVRYRLSESSRDPLVRGQRVDIAGVMERETNYWVGGVPGARNGGPVPADIQDRLQRYRNFTVTP